MPDTVHFKAISASGTIFEIAERPVWRTFNTMNGPVLRLRAGSVYCTEEDQEVVENGDGTYTITCSGELLYRVE